MGTCRFYSLAVRQLPLIILVSLPLIVFTDANCEPGKPCCQLQECWDLYQLAKSTLGVRDTLRPKHMEPKERQDLCTTLRTFHICIQNMTRHGGCTGNLNFHGSNKVVEKKMKQSNCSSDGTVFIPSEYKDISRPRAEVCTYEGKGQGPYRFCELFGDPHLRTFNNEFQTCRVRGAWPLLSNDILTVQVTNDDVGLAHQPATATSKLTVVVNSNDDCASNHYLTYQAQSDLGLPATFTDGRHHAGRRDSVLITEVEPGQHVEIYLRYVDTTLVVRIVGDFFTFAIRMPEELVNARPLHSTPDMMQLCVEGCPKAERIDYHQFFRQKRSESSSLAMDLKEAEARCRHAGVVDYYFDSCVFDLISTGDLNFTKAAKYALNDALRLFPQGTRPHNRTRLLLDEPSSSWSMHRTPYWAGCCSPGTLCLLLVTCCLVLSHTRTS